VKRITLLSRHQFGYHTDFYYYAKYLKRSYTVTVICLDSNLPKFDLEDVDILYVGTSSKSRIWRYLSLAWRLFGEIRKPETILLIKYFLGASIPFVFSSKANVILDLRSLSVNRSRLVRFIEDSITKFESRQFTNLTIVSGSLARKIRAQNATIVGLGGEMTHRVPLLIENDYSTLNIVYVGSLDGRGLDFVIRAIAGSERRNKIELKIVGNFQTSQGRALLNLSRSLGLDEHVKFEGYLKGESLTAAIQNANLGLVHIPPTSFYNCQPSTKLYEYWSWGLPVLVSDYGFVEQDIPSQSGIVYEYKIEALQRQMALILDSVNPFDFNLISELAERHSWERVVAGQLVPAIEKLEM
jgi:glycosyltransferase involved in cell wall biosynthesis